MGLHTAEAIGLADVVTVALKMTAGRARPYASADNAANFQLFRGLHSDEYRSFPSGHSTSAFAFAAAVSSETQRWWPNTRWIIGPILYSGATLTGMSRIYNQQHWASDVMAGAAIGTLVGIKVVRYQHSHPGNFIDRKLLRAKPVVVTSLWPAEAIVDYAANHAIDVTVIGTHGRRGFEHLLMGSVAERVVRTAPCPVLTVRHPEREFVAPDALVTVAKA